MIVLFVLLCVVRVGLSVQHLRLVLIIFIHQQVVDNETD